MFLSRLDLSRLDPPGDVDASDDIGNYVDISWSPVSGASYYRIYRSEVENHNGYEEIGGIPGELPGLSSAGRRLLLCRHGHR